MDQLTLFPGEGGRRTTGREYAVVIRSGRVGPIRFGATEASYALTRTVLTALAAAVTEADDDACPAGPPDPS